MNATENRTSDPVAPSNNLPNDNSNYPRNNHGQGIESQTLNQLLGIPQNSNQENFVNFDTNASPGNLLRINSANSGDLSVRPDKISQIISNWRLKYSGNSSGLSIDAFIYRVEALTNQTLGGNFDLLCRNASALFEAKACDWYWRYHKSVREIKWPDLCFDAFYDSILELVDHLDQPLGETLMIEILRRNILPEIQHEILNLQIFSVDHLRDICRKREFFSTGYPKTKYKP